MKAEVVIKVWFTVKPSIDKLLIKRGTYEFLPKEKFIRRNNKYKLIEKGVIAEYDISDIPFIIKKVKRSRSWLGNGFQNDDINCYEEWEEDEKIYDTSILNEFIGSKLKLHKPI